MPEPSEPSPNGPASSAITPSANMTNADAENASESMESEDSVPKNLPPPPASISPPKSIQLNQKQKILILGDYETGKTTWARWMLSQLPRYMAWDPTWAFPESMGVTHTLKDFEVKFKSDGKAVYQPEDRVVADDDKLWEEFDKFCFFAAKQSNAMAFLDEPAMVLDSKSRIPPGFNLLHRTGHKYGVGTTMATHRFHGDLPALCRILHHAIIFRCTVDTDLDALEGLVGRDAVAIIREQPDYHWYYRGMKWRGPCPPIRLVKKSADTK